MKKRMLMVWILVFGIVYAKDVLAISKEALQKEEVAVLEIPELSALAAIDDHLPKEMELQSYSFGASHDVVGSSVTKNVVFQDLYANKVSDEWSPILLKAAIEGRKFGHVIVEVKRPLFSARIDLKEVTLSSVSMSDSIPSNGSEPSMSLCLSFQGMSFIQTKEHFKGSAEIKNPPKVL